MKRLEQAPTRERLIDDPKYMNLSPSWEKWYGVLVGLWNQDLPVFADNAAALAGGLKKNDDYRTATGQRMIVY